MAQLNSLIVTGAARFLNKLYAKDLLVSDSFTTEGTIDVGHSTPVNALIYLNGKEAFDGHDSWLRINETKAFTSGVYFGSSLIRTDAGIQVLSNGTALNATGTSFKVGVPATFADLNADYVYANTLSTSHFDLQEINQIGDNSTFYVAPSIKFPASTTTQIAITKNTSNVTIAISDSSITSTTIAGAIWTAGSKVKASGTLDGIVTGTMDGTVSSLNTSSHVLTIQVSGGNWESLTTKTITDRTAINNFNVMMYERYADSKFYPVGIVLTSYGGSGKLTYMDIFAGTSGNDSLPNVRLGNLSSIGQITYATGVTATPTGYGLYADNVYLKGVIVADSGMVGGFQLSSNSIHTANVAITSNADNSIGLSAANFTRTVAGASRTNLRFALGKNFGVSNTGQIFSSSGEIGGWTITSTALYKNTNSTTSTTAGIYLGTDGIRNYKDADTFVDIKDGVITAKAVDLTGKITATSGDIGSIHIGTSSLYSGSHTAYNSNVAGFYLGSDGKFGIGNNSSYLRYDGTNVSLSVQSLSIGGVSAATEDSVKAATETIIGTQTAATGSWTGKSDYISALSDGLQIKYWLPYAGSGNATLNLTLSGGGTTGAIAIYRQGGTYNTTSKAVVANRVTTHFPAGSMINMTYGVNRTVAVVYSGTTYTGTFTGWFADGAYDSGNTINRTRFESAIKAVTAITAGHIICGNSSGYKNIAKGLAFDLSYPLLYARSAINANATGTNNDTLASNINFSTSLAITSGAANKELYLMGDVDGSTFTIDSSTPLTTVVPSSANGKYYIPLGVMSSATYGTFVSSNRLYAYVNGSFQAVDVAAQVTADNTLILETPYTYDSTNVVFTAMLYRGGVNVSSEFMPDCFTWYKKIDSTLTMITVGYTCTVTRESMEYGGSIVCRFDPETEVAALATTSNAVLTDTGDRYLTTIINSEDFIAGLDDASSVNVYGLPTVTASNFSGYLLGTTSAQTYKIDYNELAKAIIENYSSSTIAGSAQSLKDAIDGLLAAHNTLNGNAAKITGYTAIGTADDLNNYKTPGEYYVSTNNNTITNAPISGVAFRLRVEANPTATFVKQTWILRVDPSYPNPISYIRFYNNNTSTWSVWKGEIQHLMGCIDIEDNVDLNSIFDLGEYECRTTTRAQTLSNCPVTIAFRLQVEATIQGNNSNNLKYRKQTLYPYTSSDYYVRIYNGEASNPTWTAWKKYVYDDSKKDTYFNGRTIQFRGVATGISATQAEIMYFPQEDYGSTPSITVTAASVTNVGSVTGAVDTSRTNRYAYTFTLTHTSGTFANHSSYLCAVSFKIAAG